MNHIYRLHWNRSLARWVVTSELSRSGSKGRHGSSKRRPSARHLAIALLSLAFPFTYTATAGPAGGQVSAGSGQITQSGTVTTIQQNSQTLSLNWKSFDVSAQETVNFVQPNANSLAVNRIFSATATEILGHLSANGQVWLINPNGVLFGKQAQVNVGGLVASTLDLVEDDSNGTRKFRVSGSANGSVVNEGTLTAASGGYVALMGHHVSNQGIISARLGTVALSAGSAETLTFSGNRLLHVQVDSSELDDLAENGKLIRADGGQVFMTAGAKDAVLASAVNNTGVVQAQTVENHNGTIVLLGGGAGTVNVAGTLDASAPHGGDGGFVETSGAQVNIAANSKINAGASAGRAGTWLVDPEDLTIDSGAANTIAQSLDAGTHVTEQTTATTASGAGQTSSGAGDINVNAPISWSNSAGILELDAYHAINVNSQVSGGGQVIMNAGSGALTLNSQVSGQAGVTLSTGANFVNNAGASGVSAGPSARWLVYSTNPTLDTTGGLTPGFIQYNAAAGTNPTASAGTSSGYLYSVAPTLSVTALSGPVTKTYDGTTAAPLTGSNMTVTGLLNGDAITSATGTYASADAATGINVTSPTDISTFAVANGSIPVYGYKLSTTTVTAAVGTISPKQLTASIVGTPTKVYDGTTTATLSASNYNLDGFVGGQGAAVSQPSTVAYTSPDASQTAVINAAFTSTNFTANPGTNFANYILPTSATGPGIINQAPVNLTGLLAYDKTYDGTNVAALNTTNAGIFGVIQPDAGSVSLDKSGAAATFAQSNAGSNIAVTVTPNSFQLTGAKASNYTLVSPSDLTANITPRSINLTNVIGTNKVYDGNTSDTLNFSNAALSGVLTADKPNVALVTSGATGTFASPNAATGIGVTVAGVSLSGSAASNYSLAQPTGVTANITPKALDITLGGTQTKPYNGTTTAVVAGTDFTISGFVGSESASITQNASAQYASPNAGTQIPVTVTLEASDFASAAGTLISNYSFPHTVTGNTGTITAIPLTAYITNNPTKTYDGTTSATLTGSNYVVTGFVGSESATISQPVGTYAAKDAGPELVTANVTTANYTAGSGTLLSNYVLPTTVTGWGTIQQAALAGSITGEIVGNPTKTYDGTTTATLTSANYSLTGFAPGEGATVTQTVGQYASPNAGIQTITATLTSGDFTPDSGTNLSNYQLPNALYGTGTINPKPLTATIVGNPTKVYDGTTTTALLSSNYHLCCFVGSEGATVNPSSLINYDSKDVGARTLTAALTPSAYTANGGTLLSNYVLPTSASGPGQITPAPLYVTGVAANDRVYDATTAATLDITHAGLSGLVSGESSLVTLNTTTSGTFAQADVANNIAVSTAGFSISGAGASNYSLQPVTGLHANITPAPLTIQQVTANDKTYDSYTTATLNTTNATLSGVLNSDDVTLNSSGAAGTFASANAGSSIPVTASGFTLSGPKAFDYTVAQPTNLSATINPAQITATIIGNPTKAYDGSNSATLTSSDYRLDGFAAGQNATVPQSATANYLSADAGSNIGLESTLVISDFVANAGTNLANYIMPSSATGTQGTITPKVLSLSGTRVYDATTNASSTLFGTLTGLNGDALTVSGTGTLTSKKVGVESFSSLGSLTLSAANGGTKASNYTLVGGTDWVNITPAPLTVTGTTGSTRVYDGTTAITISNAALQGVLPGDVVTLGNDTTGNFLDKNIGTNKTIVTAMTIGGTDSGNYTLIQPTDAVGTVTGLHINVTASGVDKQYDGNTKDSPLLSSAGVLAGDHVTFSDTSATFADPNVGNGKTVSVSGITAGGADAGNYILDNTTYTTSANITPRVLNLTGTRQYDAGTDADATLFAPGGVLDTGIGTQTLTLTGSGVLASKNFNSQQPFSLSSLTLRDGTNGGVATNYTLVGGSDWVDITKAPLTVINTSVTTRPYDGTTTAQLTGATLQGVLGSDTVNLQNDTSGTFADKNVGTNKPVTTAMTITGTDANNYTLQQPTLEGTITSKSITVVATGVDKSYDGTTTANVTLGSSGVANNDSVTFSDGSATFASKDVGTAIGISVSGIVLSGADASNYTLGNTTASTSADITPAIISLTGTRVYNGQTSASASLFVDGNGLISAVDGEKLTLTGTGTLSSKDVNTRQTFSSLSGFTLGDGTNGGKSSNYTLTGGTDYVDITPLHITVDATGANKTYDGGVLDPGVTLSSAGVLSGDTVSFTAGFATFSNKNVQNGKTVTVSRISISGGASASDYAIDNTFATTTADITPLAITVVATGANKVYDTTVNDPVTLASSQVIHGDIVNFSDAWATFATKDVGTGKTVTVSGISATGADANNYTYNSSATTTANITQAPLTIVNTQVSNKTYDGSTAATLSGATLQGVLGSDLVTLGNAGTGSFADPNAGTGKAVSTAMIISGADAINYAVTQPGGLTANIAPVILDLQGSRQYDASTNAAATLFGNAGVLNGVNGQTLTLTGTGTLASKNVSPAQSFSSLAGFTLTGNGGALASNYTLIGGTDWVRITAAPLSVINTQAANKTYDGNTGAVLSGATLSGVLGTDDVVLGNSTVGTFSDKNAGTAKAVTTAMTLNGSDVANYQLSQPTGLTADINQRTISVVASAQNKVYDGTTTSQASLSSLGIVSGDTITFSDTSATFSDKNVGTGKTVTVNGISLGGADAANYAYNTTATTTANITPKALTVTANSVDKVYDGNTNDVGASLSVTGIVAGDNVTLTQASAAFDNKNAGTGKTVTVEGISASGADASNYSYNSVAVTKANITPAPLSVAGTVATDRVYDGTVADALSGATLSGVVSGDNVVLGNDTTGTFENKNVGTGKAVTTAMTISGADAANYMLEQPTGLAADITAKSIAVSASGSNKVYDGNTRDVVKLGSTGIASGDAVSFTDASANFSNPNVGNAKTVTVRGIQAVGPDAANYIVTNDTATTIADITPSVGVQDTAVAVDYNALSPTGIATPYGVAPSESPGQLTGNKKLTHRPVERNKARVDFNSGLSLQVIDGGVRMPAP